MVCWSTSCPKAAAWRRAERKAMPGLIKLENWDMFPNQMQISPFLLPKVTFPPFGEPSLTSAFLNQINVHISMLTATFTSAVFWGASLCCIMTTGRWRLLTQNSASRHPQTYELLKEWYFNCICMWRMMKQHFNSYQNFMFLITNRSRRIEMKTTNGPKSPQFWFEAAICLLISHLVSYNIKFQFLKVFLLQTLFVETEKVSKADASLS